MGECPTCGNPWTNGIKVWEDVADAKDGIGPDYIGCTECNTMEAYSEWFE